MNNKEFIEYVREQRRQGLSNSQIAQKLGLRTSEFISMCRIADNQLAGKKDPEEELRKAIENAKVTERNEAGVPIAGRFPWKDEYDEVVEKKEPEPVTEPIEEPETTQEELS